MDVASLGTSRSFSWNLTVVFNGLERGCGSLDADAHRFSKGHLLDNEKLINALTGSKSMSKMITERLAESVVSEVKIGEMGDKYFLRGGKRRRCRRVMYRPECVVFL